MTRAGRILGAMAAMGAGLNDHERSGYARPRELYEAWLAREWAVSPTTRRGEGDVDDWQRAEAKRARKAAKRRRDAERTAAGQLSRRRALLWLYALERIRDGYRTLSEDTAGPAKVRHAYDRAMVALTEARNAAG